MDEEVRAEQSVEEEVKEKLTPAGTPDTDEIPVSPEEKSEEEPKKESFGVLDKLLKDDANLPEEKDEEPVEEEKPVVTEPKVKRLEEKSQDELIDDVKKWMSIAEKRKVDLERSPSDSTPPDEKYTKFIDALKTDFFGGYNDYYDQFDLPSPQYLREQLSTDGDIETRMRQWQEQELIPSIEKKFKLEDGTFVPDPTELYKKGTPTEMFIRMTQNKENEFDSQFAHKQAEKQKIIQDIQKQRDEDLKYIKENYYESDEDYQNKINEFDSIPDKIAKGELKQDMNPFAIRNIFRGIYFDELAEAKAKKAIENIHKQYNELGLYLPNEDKGTPTDATQPKGFPRVQKGSPKKSSFSMINREMNRIK